METEPKEKEYKEAREYRVQWWFLLIATLLAVLGGIVVNALYDLLRLNSSSLAILIIFSIPFILMLDVFTFFFGNFEKYKSDSKESELELFRDYLGYRFPGKNERN